MHSPMRIVILVGLFFGLVTAPSAFAQAPVAGGTASPPQITDKQLEDLVGRIALYPDDLVAIILPASTFPIQIVQADRFLQKLKQDPKLQPDSHWDASVRSLLNYPEVVALMNRDLDWTQDLGEAVVSQQADVMRAVQTFRLKVSKAGNLKTDDKQIVVTEKEVIKIVPANPEVIYVPQYQPSTVVVYQSAPVYAYYPTPYPVYYYPYPAGAAFATGFFFGAATAWACNWGGGHVDYNVNINRTDTLNINRTNPQYQQRVDQARAQAQTPQGQQRIDQAKTQAQTPQGQQRVDQARQQAQQRTGGQGGGTAWQSQKQPGEVGGGRISSEAAGARPGYGDSGAARGDAFGQAGRGSEAHLDASRGYQSRSGSPTAMSGEGFRGSGAGGSSFHPSPEGGGRGGFSPSGGGGFTHGGGGGRGGRR